MTKRASSPTRAQKIATTVIKGETSIGQTTASVTSMVARAGRPKLIASYATLVKHRAGLVDRVRATIDTIRQSYAENDQDDHRARSERRDLADEALDYLIARFDQNGFSNTSDRLAMAWLMLDLLKPIGHRTDEVLDQIEKTFHLRGQRLSRQGLGSEIMHRRARQIERRKAA